MISKVSIIIPCYNSGLVLLEALESIKACPEAKQSEIIIVNDGSTDGGTIALLASLKKEGYTVICQENGGPAAARNTGVRESKGEFLLFLDSDNKVRPRYIKAATEILENDSETGVVYGNPAFFGETHKRKFKAEQFDLNKILGRNYIDMCAVVRKKVWDDVQGFDEAKALIGHEDWDFWISASKKGWKFYHLDEVMYDYRISTNSLIEKATVPEKMQLLFQYLMIKHIELYSKHYISLYVDNFYFTEDAKRPFRTLLKHLYLKYLKKDRKVLE
jgi:glycosyltransferase involved in cell wall biosynthesis